MSLRKTARLIRTREFDSPRLHQTHSLVLKIWNARIIKDMTRRESVFGGGEMDSIRWSWIVGDDWEGDLLINRGCKTLTDNSYSLAAWPQQWTLGWGQPHSRHYRQMPISLTRETRKENGMTQMTYREKNEYRRWYENMKRESWNEKFRQLRKTRREALKRKWQLNKNWRETDPLSSGLA